MKNKYFSLLFGAFFACNLATQAETRTFDAMVNEAYTVLQEFGPRKVAALNLGSSLQLLEDCSQMSAIGYVDGGFAYVSKDDNLPAVLFYSDGKYEETKKNPVFESYIFALDAYLAHCAADGVAPSFVQQKVTLGNPDGVSPIVKAKWGQSSPFNLLCPTYNDTRCLTGCVATAAAMAIRTLGTPITLRGQRRYSFTNDGNVTESVYLNFNKFSVDYDNLLDTYEGTENYLQRKALSELMFACGVAASMDYSLEGSGSYGSVLNSGLNKFFKGIKGTYYGQTANRDQQLYDEIDAGRAVVYSGYTTSNAGHCFIIDGYDKKGNVHINLGWSGQGDCYTTLANMGGYGNYPSYNFIQPAEDFLKFSSADPLDEVKDKYIKMDMQHPATEVEPGKWYGLYSVGRGLMVYSSGIGKQLKSSYFVPSNEPSDLVASLLVRFVESEDGKGYYIQTGTGDYFGTLQKNSFFNSSSKASSVYTLNHIQDGFTKEVYSEYFCIKNGSLSMYVDSDDEYGGGPLGQTVAPSDTTSNSSWQLYPVELRNEPFSTAPDDIEVAMQRFDPEHTYQLQLVTGNTQKLYLCTDYKGNVDDVPAPVRISNSTKRAANLTFSWNGYGWEMKDDEGRYVGIGTTEYALGTEVPETWFFEPQEEEGQYRIHNGGGYLGVDKRAIGAAVFRNKTPGWNYGVWMITDMTDAEGIEILGNETETAAVYDLQGRRILQPQTGQIYIQNGQKIWIK